MPTVGLIVTNPQVIFGDDEFGGREGWRLSFDASLSNSYLQRVDLTTDESDIKNLKGTVGFESNSKEPHKGFQKGSLTYWKGSDDDIFPVAPSYLVTLRMSDADLAELVKTISAGISLMSVSLSFSSEDMGSGYRPDGSHKKWDNRAKPAIEIQGYRMFFGKPEEEEVVPDPPEPSIETETKMLAALRDIARTVRYVLYAIVALTAAVFLGRGFP